MPWEKVVKLIIELLYKTTATNTFSPTLLFFLLLFDTFCKRLVIFENENIIIL